MAWQLSHSTEAIVNAYGNLQLLDFNTLVECLAEITAYKKAVKNANIDEEDISCPDSYFDEKEYKTAIVLYKKLPQDALEDLIWQYATNHGVTDNGGHNLHICPYGCHTVSLGNIETEEDDTNNNDE